MSKFAAILILAAVTSNTWAGTKIYRDRDAFVKDVGQNAIVDFTDVADMATDQPPVPFTSEGVLFTQGFVQSLIVELPASVWFPEVYSTPKFMVGPLIVATFPNDVNAAGTDFTCFACDVNPNDTSMNWTLLSSSGSIIDSGSTVYDFSSWQYAYTPFLGITSDTPFRSIVLGRTNISQEVIPNWFAYHLRYGPTLPSKTLLLPASVRAHGLLNTFFTTDAWISNGSSSALTVKVDFLRAGGFDNSMPQGSNTIALGPRETRVVPDILGTMFSASEEYGPLRFTATGEGVDRLVVGSHTSTFLNGGQSSTYGLSVDAREMDVSDLSPLHLVGLPQNAAYRTNVGIINLSSSVAEFTLALNDSAGKLLETVEASLPPYGTTQSHLISLFQGALGASPSYDGLAITASSRNGAALAAYAIAVDNKTGDSTFIEGVHTVKNVTAGVNYLPDATIMNGMFGTRTSSRLAVRNIDSQQSVKLSFSLQVPNSQDQGETRATKTLAPGETLVISDVIRNLFGLTTGHYGSLRAEWTSSGLAPVFSCQFM